MKALAKDIRSLVEPDKKVIAIALSPAKDLSIFYKGLLPFLKGIPEKGYQIIFLTGDTQCNGNSYLEKEGLRNIFVCDPEHFKELDFVDCFIVWDYCSYEWDFPEQSKVLTLQHYYNFYSPPEIASTYGYRTDYTFLIRGNKEEYARYSEKIETAASLTFPFRMLKKNGCLIPGGYPEIDVLYNNYHPSQEKCITFCTTGVVNNDRLLPDYGIRIISILLNSFPEYSIFFRPTPSDRDMDYVQTIEKSFAMHKNFYIDTGDLQDTINRTGVLVSDCSGLKEVFTIATSIPYIHCDFSMGKKYPEKEKLGYKITKFEDLVPLVNQILHGETVPRMVLDSCQTHLGCSAAYLLENIDYILDEKIHPQWFYYENRKKAGRKDILKPEDYFPYIQAFIGIDTMRSISMRIITSGLVDFPDSVFLLGTKAKLHFYMGEYEMAQACLARANAISPAGTAETVNIVRCEKNGVKDLIHNTYHLAKKGELKEIMKKTIELLKR